ncbi:hypothetical protein N8T08_008379 [Aspergillus melleus]|uniref:Uncharacterized protein n=1 Tax=Aspergillus melleus TaxID=138277 RepID=A0ACC3AW59_9EURO|nr:hypothetical protein N8T08_008379 [Aspergillus melleus]
MDSPAPWSFSLDLAGVVSLADISVVAQRTALTGSAAFLDILVLSPGLHCQQKAAGINDGEYPAAAAMTTGYVFRVENPATIYFLKNVGRTGELTTLSVNAIPDLAEKSRWLDILFAVDTATPVGIVAYFLAVGSTLSVLFLLVYSRDWWGLSVITLLIINRLINFFLVRARGSRGWRGAREDGDGDLLVLLSQDRWIRMIGAVNDLKAVTSGQWLRDMTWFESTASGFATLLAYINAALASNAKPFGKVLLMLLLFGSAGLLALVNVSTRKFQMHGHIVTVQSPRRKFRRRLDLAEALIKDSGRADWALRLGMINSIPENANVQFGWNDQGSCHEGVTL